MVTARIGYEPGSATMKQSEGGSEVIEVKLTQLRLQLLPREVVLQPIYF